MSENEPCETKVKPYSSYYYCAAEVKTNKRGKNMQSLANYLIALKTKINCNLNLN